MLVLGLDTATEACTVAVTDDGRLLAEATVVLPRAHSARLMPLVDQVMRESGRAKGDLQAVAAGVGPGSFTGLRIGLATAKAVAFALGIPCVSVGSLAAVAYGLGPGRGWVAPLLDARRGEVYGALYRWDEALVEALPPRIEPLTEFLPRLEAMAGPITVGGDGCGIHREAIARHLGERAVFLPAGLCWPRGWAVAALGTERLAQGGGEDPDHLAPLYLRATEAERRRQALAGGAKAVRSP